MKKVLLASTALVAFGAVAANAAEPVKLGLGGFMSEWVGVASNKMSAKGTKFDRYDVQSDVNINFLGSTKLDNGISVAVQVETFGSQRRDSRNGAGTADGLTANSNVKRSYLTLSGGFGALIVGEREDALYIVHNAAPDVGTIGLQDGNWTNWSVVPTNHRVFSATTTSRYDGRTNKISYVTPAFYGLAAAASYVPDISIANSGHTAVPASTADANATGADAWTLNSGDVSRNVLSGDLFGAGLAYTGEFSGIKIKADAGAGRANAAGLMVYQGGTQVSYAGFTFGASILNRHVDNNSKVFVSSAASVANPGVKTYAYAGQSWDAGLSYTTGPVAVSLGYFHDSSKDFEGRSQTGAAAGAADSTAVWTMSAAYTMGPGVAWQNSLSHVRYRDGGGSTKAGEYNASNALVTGVKVTF